MRSNATFECRVEIGRQVRRKDDDAVVPLELLQEHAHHGVRLTLEAGVERGRTLRCNRVCFVEEQHCAFFPRRPKDCRHVLWRFAHPQGLELRVADEQQTPPQRMGECFGADGLACPRRARKVEGERQSRRMPFAEPPTVEDEVMLRHLRKCVIQRAPCRGREDYVIERTTGNHGLDGATSLSAKQPGKRKGRHSSSVCRNPRRSN